MPVTAGAVGAAERRRATGSRLIGLGGVALMFPALRRFGELPGSRLSPLRKLLLQVDGSEFYIGEPFITIFDKIFESLVRRYHP